ncbi:hypothetical protein GS597_08530 [Synechococcales cyanobacterium C]|uniref:Uncharacterized protein n=1 Tax=Petrachloros mirabilis ULC683 TaxID=2781853 RepID=A0A8K1ZYR4_9CYAN|nr:hypothetical protein [Petrachloros mirabilis]NCJ06553.1 hypothetical protein [Petrachloros mirabilis ULC683]
MNGQLQTQTAAWWRLITSSETLGTYQKTLDRTWQILQETAKLLWLVLCLGLVVFTGFWNGSIRLGRSVRAWVDQLEDPKSSHLLPEAGRTLIAIGKTAGLLALWQARAQLGLANTGSRPTLASTLETMPKSTSSSAPPLASSPVPVSEESEAEESKSQESESQESKPVSLTTDPDALVAPKDQGLNSAEDTSEAEAP